MKSSGSGSLWSWRWLTLMVVVLTLETPGVAQIRRPGLQAGPRVGRFEIRSSLAPESRLLVGQEVRFTVTVFDPDGDRVSVKLLNPPGATGPSAMLTVPGAVSGDFLGDAAGQTIQFAEVDGDQVLDVVASAMFASAGGVFDTGAVYVFAGGGALLGAVAPSATLSVPGATMTDQLGRSAGQGAQLVDVTGDGALDLVLGASLADIGGTVDAGAVYVFSQAGGLSGSLAPHASLTVPGAAAGDQLGL